MLIGKRVLQDSRATQQQGKVMPICWGDQIWGYRSGNTNLLHWLLSSLSSPSLKENTYYSPMDFRLDNAYPPYPAFPPGNPIAILLNQHSGFSVVQESELYSFVVNQYIYCSHPARRIAGVDIFIALSEYSCQYDLPAFLSRPVPRLGCISNVAAKARPPDQAQV